MVRTIMVAILLALAGFPLPVESQDDTGNNEETPIPEIEVLERMDRNGDRFLETAEIPGPARDFVDRLVTDSGAEKEVIGKNGRIDLDRLKSHLQKNLDDKATDESEAAKNSRAVSNRDLIVYAVQLISLYDKDGDGSLAADEFEKLASKWVECDLNRDFRLEVVEVAYGLKHALQFPKKSDGTINIRQEDVESKRLNEAFDDWRREQEREQNRPPMSQSDQKDRSREYAQALISNYDRNRDATLDPKELAQIGESWLEADFDGDGKATVDEIQVRFQDYAARAKSSERGSLGSVDSTDTGVSKTEKWPPDVFEKLDADQDGQVEMHEFAQEFDASVVADFYFRDANRDGVITRNEWNRFLAKQNKESNADPRPDKN